MPSVKKTSDFLRTQRLRSRDRDRCGELLVACLWPKHGENLGSLVRTADALQACIAAPRSARPDVRKGLTIGEHQACIHWVNDPYYWLSDMNAQGNRIVAVELAHNAVPIYELEPRDYEPTIVVVGNETIGIPEWALALAHDVIEIPMYGVGNSLNVAVAGSLALYKVAGLV